MSYTPIGLAVATEVLEAMRLVSARFWYEWGSRYDDLPTGRKEELQKELQQLLEACRAAEGDWEHIDFDPTTGAGLDRAIFVKIWQDSTDNPLRPVAIWLKNGSATTAWSKVWPAPAADDHLVGVSAADIAASKWGPLANKARGDNITVTARVETDPTHGEQVVFSATPSAPPAGEGSWLYTGSIQASNLLDPVKAFIKSLQGMGGLDPGQVELWDVLENGDYQHKAVGQLYGLAPDGTETFVVAEGQRVWLTVWLESGTTYRGGLCTVLTLGDGSTKAVLRPTADVLEVGSTFTVEGVGAEYEGWYWEVLSLPDKVLAYRPGYINETSWNLFTSTQVSQAGSTTREASVTIPGGTSGGTNFDPFYFEMLDVLGVSTIPKGVVNWEVKAYVVSDDPAATVFVRANLTTAGGVSENFGYADTPPIHNTSAAILRMQGTIAADRTVNPSSKLGAVFYGYSNSASPVTIKLVYNDANHSTRVQTPLTTASFGTLSHRLLTPTSKGWLADQERWSAQFEHPEGTVCPRFPADVSATIGEHGILTIPDNCSGPVRVTGSELRAIVIRDADGNLEFGKQAPIRLHFSEACTVYHLDSLTGVDPALAARVALINTLPDPLSEGDDRNIRAGFMRTFSFYLDQVGAGSLTWYPEIGL